MSEGDISIRTNKIIKDKATTTWHRILVASRNTSKYWLVSLLKGVNLTRPHPKRINTDYSVKKQLNFDLLSDWSFYLCACRVGVEIFWCMSPPHTFYRCECVLFLFVFTVTVWQALLPQFIYDNILDEIISWVFVIRLRFFEFSSPSSV